MSTGTATLNTPKADHSNVRMASGLPICGSQGCSTKLAVRAVNSPAANHKASRTSIIKQHLSCHGGVVTLSCASERGKTDLRIKPLPIRGALDPFARQGAKFSPVPDLFSKLKAAARTQA